MLKICIIRWNIVKEQNPFLICKTQYSSFSLLIFITLLLYVKIFYAILITLALLDLIFKICSAI